MTFLMQHDGRTFAFHTEVGDGLTKPVFDEIKPQQQLAATENQQSKGVSDDCLAAE